ncbi:MAG TPA: NUDIX domain-containing protein [Acidimicrobiia bacterium]|nr:NUDIX domain-containing protein [Acidimicrobiia bacterium]
MESAGLVPYRRTPRGIEILIAHPGGPFWARRHEGSWSIVKGEVEPGEDPLTTAAREFFEETGWHLATDDAIPVGEVVQKAGKRVRAWAVEAAALDPSALRAERITVEWRGRWITFPEIDEVRWCDRQESARLLNPAQVPFHDRLIGVLDGGR